jgi:nitroimidazol reductase NimA-like FMN-containing flavoprotein (pyridoxamine 5'-phosphate oxidase superfamily)
MSDTISTPSTKVRREPERARYDRETIDAILDEAFICHVGFLDEGHPVVIPTIHVRVGDRLILHGSPAGRMMRTIASGAPVSIAVTLFDGLVLARSVFHHSMNYRSVVLFGTGQIIDDPAEKLVAMRVFTERILPGRWDDVRPPTDLEFRGTLMAAVPIDAASAKTRTGPPEDEESDLGLDTWAGVIPYRLSPGEPVPSPDLQAGIDFPAYLAHLLDR